MRLFGYARTSINQQSLDVQVKTLKAEGVESSQIFTDRGTGNNIDRIGLSLLQNNVQHGDVVFVTKLDRIGRNIAELIDLIKKFNERGVTLRVLDEDISTEGAMGRTIVAVLSAAAQAERQSIHERTSEGRLEAKEKGVKFGRKPTIDRDKVQALRIQGLGATDIARRMKIGRSTVYKILQSFF